MFDKILSILHQKQTLHAYTLRILRYHFDFFFLCKLFLRNNLRKQGSLICVFIESHKVEQMSLPKIYPSIDINVMY